MAVIKTLIHRVYKICNTWILFNKNIIDLKEVLKRNKYPDKIIDNEIKKYLNKTFENEKHDETRKENINFYKLPYFGTTCKLTKQNINKLGKDLCNELNIYIIFTASKIKSFLPTKSTPPPPH